MHTTLNGNIYVKDSTESFCFLIEERYFIEYFIIKKYNYLIFYHLISWNVRRKIDPENYKYLYVECLFYVYAQSVIYTLHILTRNVICTIHKYRT